MKKPLVALFLTLSLAGCGAHHEGHDHHDHHDHHGHHEEQHDKHEQQEERAELKAVDRIGPLQVMASFYPLAYLLEQVGGEAVQVTNMTPIGGEPHDYEPSPRELASLQEADLFVFMGEGLEPWADDVVKQIEGINALEMSQQITLMKHQEEEKDDHNDHHDDHGHHHGHDHGEFDPHVWLDPVMMQELAEKALEALVAVDPTQEEQYQSNAEAFIAELQQLDQDIEQSLSNCKLDTAIVSHDAFSYLGKRYDIRFAAISGLSPQAEPSARHLAELSDLANEKGIQHIFFETLISPKMAETIASEVGAETLVLNPLEGLTSDQQEAGADYLSLMRDNMNNLKTALQCL